MAAAQSKIHLMQGTDTLLHTLVIDILHKCAASKQANVRTPSDLVGSEALQDEPSRGGASGRWRASQPAAKRDLVDGHAPHGVAAAFPVGGPAVALVEPPRTGVAGEHPQVRIGDS